MAQRTCAPKRSGAQAHGAWRRIDFSRLVKNVPAFAEAASRRQAGAFFTSLL